MLTVDFDSCILHIVTSIPTDSSVPTSTSVSPLDTSPVSFIPIVLSIINVIILSYTLKITRDNSGFTKWVNTIKESSLLVNVIGIRQLQILLTNAGEVPIDKVEVKIEGTIIKKDNVTVTFKRTYKCKTILTKGEKSTISLYRDFEPFLLTEELMRQHSEEISTGEIGSDGEYIMYDETYTHIVKPFAVNLSLKTTYVVHNATKTIDKQFIIDFNYSSDYGDQTAGDPDCQYSENYDIRVNEEQWASSP